MEAAATGRNRREERRIAAAAAAAQLLNQLLHLTYRMSVLQPSYAMRRRAGEPVRCIYSVWHESLWHGIQALKRQEVCVTVSAHRDGEIIARVAARMGYDLARGSSTRGGARAMRDLARYVRDARGDLAVIVDGPQGPARVIKEGVLFAASLTGLPIVPVGVGARRAWRTRSWDRHLIGKPFTRVRVVFGPELRIPTAATRDDLLQVWRERLQHGMDRAEQDAQHALER